MWSIQELAVLERHPHHILYWDRGIQWCSYRLTCSVTVPNTFPFPFVPISMNSFQLRTPAIYFCHPFCFLIMPASSLQFFSPSVLSLLAFFTHICFRVLFLNPSFFTHTLSQHHKHLSLLPHCPNKCRMQWSAPQHQLN